MEREPSDVKNDGKVDAVDADYESCHDIIDIELGSYELLKGVRSRTIHIHQRLADKRRRM